MAYKVEFRRRAKKEFQDAAHYTSEFREGLSRWLTEIAVREELNSPSGSIGMDEVIERLQSDVLADSRYALEKWKEASLVEKLAAIYYMIVRREFPWELRFTVRWFYGILGAFDCEVHAYYEVDHVKKRVVFTMFTGLPGQER